MTLTFTRMCPDHQSQTAKKTSTSLLTSRIFRMTSHFARYYHIGFSLFILSVILAGAQADQQTTTESPMEDTTSYQTTTAATPITSYSCDCTECIGENEAACNSATDSSNNYLYPVKCPADTNCTAVLLTNKMGVQLAYVRKCMAPADTTVVPCGTSVAPDVYQSKRLSITVSQVNEGTCTVQDNECPGMKDGKCARDYTLPTCTVDPANNIAADDQPSCGTCTGAASWAECDNEYIITPCTETDPVCLQTESYDANNQLTSVSVACASYSSNALFTNAAYYACSRTASSTCKRTTPATYCANERQMCATSAGNPSCTVCTGAASESECDANGSPVFCPYATDACLLTVNKNTLGSVTSVSRACERLDDCDAKSLPLNVQITTNNNDLSTTENTCKRATCSDTLPCKYFVCPICDVTFADEGTNAASGRVACISQSYDLACGSGQSFCQEVATSDDRGNLERYQIQCADTSDCSSSSYFSDTLQDCPTNAEQCRCYSNICSDTVDEIPTTADPCTANPCLNQGVCVSTAGLDTFYCECIPGWTGTFCQIESTIYPYAQPGDQVYKSDDDSTLLPLDEYFNFFGTRYKNVYLSANGYVTFGTKFTSPNAQAFPIAKRPHVAMIAPLWSDWDSIYSRPNNIDDGCVFYRTYYTRCKGQYPGENVQNIFDQVKTDVTQSGDNSFDPNSVTIITWVNVTQYEQSSTDPSAGPKATFQLVLANDDARYRSYAIFVYWRIDSELEPFSDNTRQGYFSEEINAERVSLELTGSGTSAFLQLPQIGAPPGHFAMRTTRDQDELTEDSSESKCWEWNCNDMMMINQIQAADKLLPVCPCTYSAAVEDCLFSVSEDNNCAVSTTQETPYARQCCYDVGDGSLITSDSLEAGSLFRFHPTYYPENHQLYDLNPKQSCCGPEEPNCAYFYEVRPNNDCSGYTAPVISAGYGDPHFITIDGFKYSYQGWGEYYLLKDDQLVIQGRTSRATNLNGDAVSATVWTAVAVKDSYTIDTTSNDTVSGNRVQVELMEKDGQYEMDIHIQETDTDLTDWFKNAKDKESIVSSFVNFQKLNSKLVMLFPSGIRIDASVGVKQLVFSVVYPRDKLSGVLSPAGLLGTPDGDTTNDLTLPDGTTLPANSNCRTISDNFGTAWQIKMNTDSLFRYTSVKTFVFYNNHPNYVASCIDVNDPSTWGVPQDEQTAIQGTCNADLECITDYVLTGDKELAEATSAVAVAVEDSQSTLVQVIPIIQGSTMRLRAQIGMTSSMNVSAINTAKAVTLTPPPFMPDGATFDAATGDFTWAIADYDVMPFDLVFGGVDADGVMANPLAVTIEFCNCTSDRGQCLEGSYTRVTGTSFYVAECICEKFYTGPGCLGDYNPCILDDQCKVDGGCTDVAAADQVLDPNGPSYYCIGCDEGYEPFLTMENNTKCRDIDECVTGNNTCTQQCVNTPGSYKCLCDSGYLLAGDGSCSDIDECDLDTDGCEQICNNVVGSFFCTCRDGFINSTDTACEPEPATEAGCLGKGCSYCAEISTGVYGCFCPEGYETDPNDNTKCVDKDECSDGSHQCDPNAECGNLEGGYNCTCNDGYTLNDDLRTCSSCPLLRWGPNCMNVCSRCFNLSSCDNEVGCTDCLTGYTGTDCAADIDECVAKTDNCDTTTSVCQNIDGSFLCLCLNGFVREAGACVAKDECIQSDANGPVNPCGRNGVCIDQFMGYLCNCSIGFTGDNCMTNIDDCEGDPCLNGGSCNDLVNSFSCDCVMGTYGHQCQHFECEVNPANLTAGEGGHTYNGSLTITNLQYTADLANTSSSNYLSLSAELEATLEIIYGCSYDNTSSVFLDVHDLVFSNGSVKVSWYLSLTEERTPLELETALRENINSFNGYAVSNDSVAYRYAFVIPPTDTTTDMLAIVLGSIGAVLGLCAIVAIVLCVLWRVRIRDRVSETDTESEDRHKIKPYMLPRFGRLHWQDVPSMRASSAPSHKSDEDTRPYAPPVIPRARIARPNVDWSILRNFSTRFGSPPPTAPEAPEPADYGFRTAGAAPRVAARRDLLHRGPPPFQQRGNFFWLPTDNGDDNGEY